MKSADFIALKQEFDKREDALLGVKKTEYANDDDRLANFKEASRMIGLTPEHYCLVLTAKHFHAIVRAVTTGKYDWCWNNELGEGMKQRIADLRNYLVLLAAIMEERRYGGDSVIVKEDDGYHD